MTGCLTIHYSAFLVEKVSSVYWMKNNRLIKEQSQRVFLAAKKKKNKVGRCSVDLGDKHKTVGKMKAWVRDMRGET